MFGFECSIWILNFQYQRAHLSTVRSYVPNSGGTDCPNKVRFSNTAALTATWQQDCCQQTETSRALCDVTKVLLSQAAASGLRSVKVKRTKRIDFTVRVSVIFIRNAEDTEIFHYRASLHFRIPDSVLNLTTSLINVRIQYYSLSPSFAQSFTPGRANTTLAKNKPSGILGSTYRTKIPTY